MPEKINLTQERFILTDAFRGFHPWLVGSIAIGPVTRLTVMEQGHGGAKCLLDGG
jgi:hypothetical protein